MTHPVLPLRHLSLSYSLELVRLLERAGADMDLRDATAPGPQKDINFLKLFCFFSVFLGFLDGFA